MKKILLFFVFGLLFSCASSDNSTCEPMALPFTNLETEYGCVNTKYFLYNSVETDSYIIIRNQNDFDTMTDDLTCRPQIDFETYDLVIGKKQLTSGNDSIQYEYIDNCIAKKLKVTFLQNETLIAPNIIYHALIPKLSAQESIEVELIEE